MIVILLKVFVYLYVISGYIYKGKQSKLRVRTYGVSLVLNTVYWIQITIVLFIVKHRAHAMYNEYVMILSW